MTEPLSITGPRPVIYVAGPFRSKIPANRWLHEQNVQRAQAWALFLAGEGAIPLCVHTMYQHFDGTLTDQFWLDATLDLRKRCDAAFFIPGWEGSTGSRLEHGYCIAHGLPTFCMDTYWRELPAFRPWLASVVEKKATP